MAIRAVIFDLGGVLVRTEDPTPREKLAQRLGMTGVELEALAFGGSSSNQAQRGEIEIERHWDNVGQTLELTPDELKAFIDEFFSGDRLDSKLVDTIRSLRANYKTALLSNAFSNLRYYLNQVWEIADAFDELVISSEVGVMKPDARIYQIVLQRLVLAPEEAVFIDDFVHNVEGARAVHMHAIHFRSREQMLAELEQVLQDVK
ncbi:HAD family hydrolase [Chloroflexota bacterium]